MSDSTSKAGDYVVVARRYRPRGFDELVGQDHVGRALKNAIETNRVGHAYLFTGARGVGKTSTARIFAKALNDPTGPTANPDNASDVAQAIDSGEDVDVIEIDGASNRGIDEIRSLRANVGVRPSRSRYKIYIIDEVHMLTGAAFNALLKTLEEPPEHVKFIFCTTDPEKLPITVLSRCQRFDFAPVEVTKIVGRLREIITAEGAAADDVALELIARRAAGSMRDSQSLLEQVLSFSDGKLTADQVHTMLGTADDVRLHALATAMANRDAAESMKQLDEAVDAGVDAGRLAEQLLGYFRDLMAVTVGCDETLMRHTSASLHGELKALGDTWGLQTVLAVVGLIDQTLVRIRLSVYSRVLMEATLIQICNLPDLQNIVNLAAAARTATDSGEKKKLAPRPPQSRPVPEIPHRPTPGTEPQAATPPHPPAAAPTPTPDPVPTSAAPQTSAANNAPATGPPAVSAAGASANTANGAASANGAAAAAPDDAAATAQGETAAVAAGDVIPLTESSASQVWAAAINRLEEVRQSLARQIERAEYLGPGKLRLVFPAEAGLTMRRCDAPDNRSAIVDAVSEVMGERVALEYHSAPPKPKPVAVKEAAPKQTRMQRMREIELNPLIKSCVEAFGAEIVRIDRPR
ncbi:DNA polymerase III subunit tau [Rubripirellula lacrimiformis]|uniref:DNA polymerase III subunit gamma/tau n=1 Tax=Rubripirellula lacrimiformis TaxID=1930273 RepID=A0A517NA73_9BACT|nr:DNA polymerase III subunit gamma/tau [Rubripirellula lacrimiformis]QDT04039.1 DNA polymerase III subunit tau [Rubripirellula lacrimiformis]